MDVIVLAPLACGLGNCVYRGGKPIGSRRGFAAGRFRRRR